MACGYSDYDPEEGQKYKYDVNDLTKVWPEDEFPLLEIGKLFAEIEQREYEHWLLDIAEPSNDPVLQARLFSYSDTARHRLGPNHLEILSIAPLQLTISSVRAGWMRVDGGAGTLPPSAPNYPSSFNHPGFDQPNALYNKEFTEVERQSLVANVIAALSNVTVPAVKQRSLNMFACVDASLGKAIGAGIGLSPACALKP
ncbi:catalase [Mycena leptocephala]|nr:catalase [Mycena leptocephala]